MQNVDYIVVGCGLASIAFCETLRANNHTFLVFDDASQKSSIVAAGLYNPVVLKRFTKVWKADEQLKIALPLYKKIERDLNIKIDYQLQILRRFASVEEQNLWFTASDKPSLEPYLSMQLVKNTNKYIDAPFGFGEVLQAGRLDTETLISNYKSFLASTGRLINESFNHGELNTTNNEIEYNDIRSKYIVFAEGFGVKKNPFFDNIPINGTKGEVMLVRIPELKIDYAIKSSVFVIPVGNDKYTVGSTYNWSDKTNAPTEQGKNELINKLKTFLKCDFEIINHLAGIRPTVKDRRPLIGQHKNYKNLFVLNGLGSRGVMIAPYVAKELYEYIEHNLPIDEEINITRFDS